MDRISGALVPVDLVARNRPPLIVSQESTSGTISSATPASTSTNPQPHHVSHHPPPKIVTTTHHQSSSSSSSITSGQHGTITSQATIERLSRPMSFDKVNCLTIFFCTINK